VSIEGVDDIGLNRSDESYGSADRASHVSESGINIAFPDLVKATYDCRRWPIGLCAYAQIEDDGPNMETYHEGAYRCSRVGHADCCTDIRSARERGSDVPGELLIRL
jgi:hypothetical protein